MILIQLVFLSHQLCMFRSRIHPNMHGIYTRTKRERHKDMEHIKQSNLYNRSIKYVFLLIDQILEQYPRMADNNRTFRSLLVNRGNRNMN